MAILRLTTGLFAVSCWCALWSIAAAETLTAEGASSAAISSDMAKLSRQLTSESFSQRRLASQELSAAGVRALPALEQAALGSDREATARAITIIQQQYASGDEETRREAETYLKRIAESNNEFAARRAHETLHPESTMPDQFHPVFGNVQARGNMIQMAQIQQMRVQIANQPQPQIRQINIRNVNGEKTITVTENDRTVKISEKKNSIEVEVTEKKDGKETTEKYVAKDANELKEKHPAGYELYKKHNQGGMIQINANIQIQAGNGQLPPQIRLPNIEELRRRQQQQRDDS